MTQNDKITVIIHTENETKLLTLLDQLHQHPFLLEDLNEQQLIIGL